MNFIHINYFVNSCQSISIRTHPAGSRHPHGPNYNYYLIKSNKNRLIRDKINH